MSWYSAYETVSSAAARCRRCGVCTPRCEVLQPEGEVLTVGGLAAAFAKAGDSEGVAALAAERPDLVFAVRRCCMDGSCTLACPDAIEARPVFAALRELLSLAGVTGMDGFTMTQVDREWHIFSAYRAVYGIYYTDLPLLGSAREWGADTLFFPGCTLASYAPELTREVLAWLKGQRMDVALSVDCCGSPLRSGGFADRCDTFKRSLVDRALGAGIKRVVFVCPGCRDEWESAPGSEALELIALPELLAASGTKPRPEKLAALAGSETPVLTMFDSCHDRDGRFGDPLRRIFSGCDCVECAHHGADAICCGAAGAVSLVDAAICNRRARRVLDEEPRKAGANLVVANCPTCAYTFAATRRADAAVTTVEGPAFCQYLDLLFEAGFDWPQVFGQLESMWSGEYGPWLAQELL
ncbi:(Fe-S)-binding protein [Adlercreutzia sp. R25]|uniref:(Fe-S)-binding protein n=1 Tax=Adlercreutzia shanghongiae TaxID=3111773 RepID=A0ABU6IXW0_9ACTN|nr:MULTISPECIES: (Fe-S)-binding protein [unclassified Adlercreutzia]MEC4272657.1 (Fe-S)-binding protein [Adlercreutzia sp. R25]MEC4294442.1 (Fe-S)-binding protein [Adlercreutzia sp. R22]